MSMLAAMQALYQQRINSGIAAVTDRGFAVWLEGADGEICACEYFRQERIDDIGAGWLLGEAKKRFPELRFLGRARGNNVIALASARARSTDKRNTHDV
jgi:hypothetical protein